MTAAIPARPADTSTPAAPRAGVTAPGSSGCAASSCPESGLRRRADRAEAQLAALRRRVHAHLAGAAYSGDLGTDVVNNILAAVDLPLLPRRWTVELTATVTCTVTAGTAEDAVDDAKELLDIAFEAMTHNSDFDVTAVVPALPVLPGDFVDPSDEPPAH